MFLKKEKRQMEKEKRQASKQAEPPSQEKIYHRQASKKIERGRKLRKIIYKQSSFNLKCDIK